MERFSEHERAIYALMCGNVDQILPVCYTWEDNVWANFKGLLHYLLEAVPNVIGSNPWRLPAWRHN